MSRSDRLADHVTVGDDVIILPQQNDEAAPRLFDLAVATAIQAGRVDLLGLDVDDRRPNQANHLLQHVALLFQARHVVGQGLKLLGPRFGRLPFGRFLLGRRSRGARNRTSEQSTRQTGQKAA